MQTDTPQNAVHVVQEAIRAGSLDLRHPAAPNWLADLIDATGWHAATTAERRHLAVRAVTRQQRQRAHTAPPTATAPADEPPRLTRHRGRNILPDPYTPTTPGTRWIGCANGCGRLIAHDRTATLRCGLCPNHRKATPND